MKLNAITLTVMLILNGLATSQAYAVSSKSPGGRYQYSDLKCADDCFEDYGRKVRALEDSDGVVGLFAIICTAGILLPAVANDSCERKKQIEKELNECLAGCVRTVK